MDAAELARSTRVETSDGVRLHVTDTGQGSPVLFLHEYAGDHRSWARQVSDLSSDHRCVTYAARGYLPSDVPATSSAYSWQRAVADAVAVLDALELGSAHVVGLSMGGYTAVQLGLHHPERVRSITAVSVGSGSDPATRAAYLAETSIVAEQLRSRGAAFVGNRMAGGLSRVQLKARDEPVWQEMVDQLLREHVVGGALLHGTDPRSPCGTHRGSPPGRVTDAGSQLTDPGSSAAPPPAPSARHDSRPLGYLIAPAPMPCTMWRCAMR